MRRFLTTACLMTVVFFLIPSFAVAVVPPPETPPEPSPETPHDIFGCWNFSWMREGS